MAVNAAPMMSRITSAGLDGTNKSIGRMSFGDYFRKRRGVNPSCSARRAAGHSGLSFAQSAGMEHQLGTSYHPVARVSYRAIVGGAITFLICLVAVLALGAGLGLTAYGATVDETGRVFGERLWFVFAM